ncbi:MAG TPA: tetraacyldisaccharide 4'-kinase, partial [Oligoflexia bacterium]|nr:tetraacyldisaccharide 4'-kinase [Oligoflexia bacterium]
VSTRGYGSSWEQRSGYATDFESAHTQKFPDEALVLLKKTPGVAVAVGKRRVDTLKRNWENLRPDVIILDDGFQHFSMNRQIDVLVHNFEIRNPLFRDFPFWFNRAGLRVAFSDVPAKLNNGPPWVRVNYRLKGVQKVNSKLESIPRTANVFCGIGNPNRIRSFLERNGVKVNAMKVFRDHQDYHLADIEGLKKWNEKNGEFPLVTTLKDAVKLRDYAQCMGGVSGFDPLWLDIGVEILDHKEYFWRKLNESVALASDSGGP